MLAADFGVNAYFRRGYVNIRRRLRLDNSRATVRLVGRRQSPDVQWRARVCWRADLVSCRSKALLHMSGTSGDAPNRNQSSRILRIRAGAAS